MRRADVAWHARVNLNEDLDVVQGELRRGLMSQDTGTTETCANWVDGLAVAMGM